MDIVLEACDTFAFDYAYAKFLPAGPAPYELLSGASNDTTAATAAASIWQYHPATSYFSLTPSPAAYLSAWPRDNTYRQFISLFFITWFFGILLYFIFATLSYVFVFDKTTFKHPKFLKNQIRMEIRQANEAMPFMSVLTALCFVAEVQGYAKLYDRLDAAPFYYYNLLQFPLFLLFTDCGIYFIHRGLHHPFVYRNLHKPHHKWIMPSPYASHAFHPLDGFAQSFPIHLFPFIFPMQKFAYMAAFVVINIWTIVIHDGEFVANSPIINGAACHTMHHLYFNYNYGQYTTLWDRLGGSYRKPDIELFYKEQKMAKEQWDKQIQEMESILKEVEGEDDREYGSGSEVKTFEKKNL
ncbi:MAG: c-5 sterol desaturase [Claussenomyces sp. TS43310]|nr:MAG: c-5 sterol desaturase [Claussenomyces sp. TS43310]